LAASRRDGRVRAAITALLDLAQQHNCPAVVIENLNFADARATGRETMGKGKRGKTFRATVAGIPTAKFRNRWPPPVASRRSAWTPHPTADGCGHSTGQARPPVEKPHGDADRSGSPARPQR